MFEDARTDTLLQWTISEAERLMPPELKTTNGFVNIKRTLKQINAFDLLATTDRRFTYTLQLKSVARSESSTYLAEAVHRQSLAYRHFR